MILKITKTYDWHVEGDIIDDNPEDLIVETDYVEKMKKDIIDER